jgi:hypothetical protein
MLNIPEIKSEYIWAVVMLGYLITGIMPLGVPYEISESTLEPYEFIENLPEGSIIVMGGSGAFAFDLEPGVAMIAAIKQMAENNLRLVTFPLGLESAQMEVYNVEQARVDEKYGGPWKYGEDYIFLPYTPGRDAALVGFLTDVWDTVPVDLSGRPLSEFPIMNDMRSYEDISLFICPHYSSVQTFRFVTGEFGVMTAHFAHADGYPRSVTYKAIYPGKVFVVNGYKGGAEYEKLMGYSGLGVATIDGYSVLSALFLIFLILGNVTLYANMNKNGDEMT